MNKNEFLQALGGKLKEELATAQIEEHLKYYNDYIKQEEGTGKSEQEVIDALGDPVLLARTILETSNSSSSYSSTGETIYQEVPDDDIYQEDNARNARRVPPFRTSMMSSWGCVATIIIILLIVVTILWLLKVMFSALAPILIPILMVLFVIAIFKQRQ